MGRSKRRAVAAICIGGGFVVLSTLPAGADVIDPPGACTASGTWQDEGVTRASGDYVPDDVVVIPQEDTVAWEGAVAGASGPTGPEREIAGEVEVDVAGVTTIKIDDWSGPSERYANSGEYEYEVPSVLVNVKMKLQGEHREEGSAFCGGSVYIQVDGSAFSNPLTLAAIVGLVLTAWGLFIAGSVKKGAVA